MRKPQPYHYHVTETAPSDNGNKPRATHARTIINARDTARRRANEYRAYRDPNGARVWVVLGNPTHGYIIKARGHLARYIDVERCIDARCPGLAAILAETATPATINQP